MTQMNLLKKQNQALRHRAQTCGCQRGKDGGGGMDHEFGASKCKLLYIGWINSKVLPCSTGNYIQYHVITYHGKEHEKNVYYICMQIKLNNFVVQQKHQHNIVYQLYFNKTIYILHQGLQFLICDTKRGMRKKGV